MTTSGRLSPRERKAAVKSVAVLGMSGTSTTADPVGWAVPAEKIAEALRTHSSCIPSAMSEWNETVPLPTTWAGWWLRRMTQGLLRCDCGMGGSRSPRTVR